MRQKKVDARKRFLYKVVKTKGPSPAYLFFLFIIKPLVEVDVSSFVISCPTDPLQLNLFFLNIFFAILLFYKWFLIKSACVKSFKKEAQFTGFFQFFIHHGSQAPNHSMYSVQKDFPLYKNTIYCSQRLIIFFSTVCVYIYMEEPPTFFLTSQILDLISHLIILVLGK